MAERIKHIHVSNELIVPVDQLQAGDEIMLSEMRRHEKKPHKQFCTSQVTMVFEEIDESLEQPALKVRAKSRVEGPAKDFPKDESFLIPLEDNGAIPLDEGLTIIAFEESQPTPKKVGGEWSRIRVSRPEERQRKTVRRLGNRALLPSLFSGFKD